MFRTFKLLNYLANFFTVPRLRTGGFYPDQLARFGASPKKQSDHVCLWRQGRRREQLKGRQFGAQEQNSSFRRASEIHEFHIMKIEFGIWNRNSCQQFLDTNRFNWVKKVAMIMIMMMMIMRFSGGGRRKTAAGLHGGNLTDPMLKSREFWSTSALLYLTKDSSLSTAPAPSSGFSGRPHKKLLYN